MLTGVIPDTIQMAVFTILRMTTERGRATGQPLPQGLDVMQRQVVAALKFRQMLFKNFLYCMLDHTASLPQNTVNAYRKLQCDVRLLRARSANLTLRSSAAARAQQNPPTLGRWHRTRCGLILGRSRPYGQRPPQIRT